MEEEQLEHRRFSQHEIGELIEIASRLDQLRHEQPGLSIDELKQVALELGISEAALVKAVDTHLGQERARRRAEEEERAAALVEKQRLAAAAEQRRKQINAWKGHAASYVGTIGGLAAIDWFSSDNGLDWVFFPAAGWGIGLAIHSLTVLFRVDEED